MEKDRFNKNFEEGEKHAIKKCVSMDVSRRALLKGAFGLGMMASASPIALHLTSEKAEAAVRTLPKKWDETIDVVVVGSGFAGLAAAAEAAGAGSQTIILEKIPTYGGNSIISGGSYSSWDDKYHLRQEQNLGDDSPAQWKQDWLKGGDFYSIPELIEVIVNGAAPTLNWMIDEGGLEIRKVLARHGGHSAFRAHMAIEAVGRPYTEALKKIAESRGAKIRLGTQVTWIWRKDMDSPVLGVEVMKGNKRTNIKVKKALILASGGFSRDVKMRMAFNPALVPEFNCTNQQGSTGEIIRYAQAIGADALHLAFIQLFPFAEPESGLLDTFATYPAKGAGYGFVYINKLGKRFVDEMERRDVVAYAQIKTGVKPTYSIFNRQMMQKMAGEKELEAGVRKGRFINGDTIVELAGKLGMQADTLQDTTAKYNT